LCDEGKLVIKDGSACWYSTRDLR